MSSSGMVKYTTPIRPLFSRRRKSELGKSDLENLPTSGLK
jgi:hypothetical protein